MKLVSMANKPKDKKEMEGCEPPCCDDAKYPYGTQISLEGDQLAALGISDLPKVGTVVSIMAKAKVVSVSSREDQDGSADQSLSLQITDLGIDSKMSDKKIGDALYGEAGKMAMMALLVFFLVAGVAYAFTPTLFTTVTKTKGSTSFVATEGDREIRFQPSAAITYRYSSASSSYVYPVASAANESFDLPAIAWRKGIIFNVTSSAAPGTSIKIQVQR